METKSYLKRILCLGFTTENVASVLLGVDFMMSSFLAMIGMLGCLPLGGLAFYLLTYEDPFPSGVEGDGGVADGTQSLNDLQNIFYLSTTIRFFWAIVVALTTTILCFRASCGLVNKSAYIWTATGLRDWENWESWKLIQSLWIMLYIGILVISSLIQFIFYEYQKHKEDIKTHQWDYQFEFPAPNIYDVSVQPYSSGVRGVVNFLQFLILYNGYKLWVVGSYVNQLKGGHTVGVKKQDEEKLGKNVSMARISMDNAGENAPLRIGIYHTIVNTGLMLLYGFTTVKMLCWDLLSYQQLYPPSLSTFVIGTWLQLETVFDANNPPSALFSVAWSLFSFICSLVFLHASIALWKGTIQRDPIKCGFWLKSQAAYIILLGVQLGYGIIFVRFEGHWIFLVTSTLVNGWMFRVVCRFMKNISNPEFLTAQSTEPSERTKEAA